MHADLKHRVARWGTLSMNLTTVAFAVVAGFGIYQAFAMDAKLFSGELWVPTKMEQMVKNYHEDYDYAFDPCTRVLSFAQNERRLDAIDEANRTLKLEPANFERVSKEEYLARMSESGCAVHEDDR